MNNKAKGTRNEHRSMAVFEAAGYQTMRSAASLSPWDFIAYNATSCVFVQVKTRDWPGNFETEILKQAVVPANAIKVIHRWRDRTSQPDVKVLT